MYRLYQVTSSLVRMTGDKEVYLRPAVLSKRKRGLMNIVTCVVAELIIKTKEAGKMPQHLPSDVFFAKFEKELDINVGNRNR